MAAESSSSSSEKSTTAAGSLLLGGSDPADMPAWAKSEAERKRDEANKAKEKTKGNRPFKWPCCTCGDLTRRRCRRCAISLCEPCGQLIHRPPCEPPPVGDAFTARYGPTFGFNWKGEAITGQPLPIYGEDDEFAWNETLFPFPGPMPGKVAGFRALRDLCEKDPAFGKRNADILKPTWYYVVPRTMFATAVEMLTQEQRDGSMTAARQYHDNIYAVEDAAAVKLQGLLDKAFIDKFLLHARGLGYSNIVRDSDGKPPETAYQLLRAASQVGSVEYPAYPLYAIRHLGEFWRMLKACGAPQAALDAIEGVHKHYNPGAPSIDTL